MGDIHAYTHPDWCQRGCLITIFRHACVLGCAQLHHISTQTLRHIHTYMHPQWGQRGCLVPYCDFLLLWDWIVFDALQHMCAWMCSAAPHGMQPMRTIHAYTHPHW